MKTNLPTPPARPAAPKSRANLRTASADSDYYTDMAVAAALNNFSGRGRGLDIYISPLTVEKFQALEELFGGGFSYSNVIVYAHAIYLKSGEKLAFEDVDKNSDGVVSKKNQTQ